MKILLRAGKSPFDVATPFQTLTKNILGTNAGNMIFAESVYKALSAPDVEITPDHYSPDHYRGIAVKKAAETINATYDMYVVPLANAFRRQFIPNLESLSALIEQLNIPVVVIGVGAQTDEQYNVDNLQSIREPVVRFVKTVLNHSASIGVRGEFTANYLESLGFKDIDVIGCPSMFLYGDKLSVAKRHSRLNADSKIAVTVSATGKQADYSHGLDAMGKIVTDHYARYPNLLYVPQESRSLEYLLWGSSAQGREHASVDPSVADLLFKTAKVRFFVDPRTWSAYLKGYDFVFGSRLHGCIAGLLAGTPAYLLVHDSRTLELARYFRIPAKLLSEISPKTDAATLYEEADYGAMLTGHKERFSAYLAFLEKNGIKHIFRHPDLIQRFEDKIAAAPFPGPVAPLSEESLEMLGQLFSWTRQWGINRV